jgi:hypothetical protein
VAAGGDWGVERLGLGLLWTGIFVCWCGPHETIERVAFFCTANHAGGGGVLSVPCRREKAVPDGFWGF